MNLLSHFLSSFTAIAITFTLLNFYIAYRGRQPINLAFFIIGLGMIIYIPCNALLYETTDPTAYLEIVGVQKYGTAFYHIGLIVLYSQYMKYSLRPVLLVYLAGFGISLAARTIDPMLHYSEFSGMSEYFLAWGERVFLPNATTSIWGYLYILFILSIYLVLMTLSIIQARRGEHQHARKVFLSLVILLIALIHDIIVFSLNLQWLFLGEVGFTAVIVIMELAVADDAIRARALAEELNKANARLEVRVAERTDELRRANEELEAFSYSVSHDLRAPLRAIHGFTKILSEDFSTGFPVEARAYLEKIQNSTQKMSQLIDGLLTLSINSRKPLTRQAVNLNQMVASIVGGFTPELAGRKITWDIRPLPDIQADPVLIQQVLENLIGNAIKYTRQTPSARIEIGCYKHDNRCIYTIQDNGIGFDMTYAEKLFKPFQRLHNDQDFEGSGIGLANVQRILARHGGEIWVESKPGQGTTFSFTLTGTETNLTH